MQFLVIVSWLVIGVLFFVGLSFGLPTQAQVDPSEFRGKVVVVVDSTQATALANELDRYELDLVGDGWEVVRIDASPTDLPEAVRAKIQVQYQADPTTVKAVVLFGRIPLKPYGFANPDGHGAEVPPADAFYGDMDGSWVETTAGQITPSTLELQVGRVDLSNMPAFPLSETELLRQYLNKNHNYRHKITVAPDRALYFNQIGGFALMTLNVLFGGANVETSDSLRATHTQPYKWVYGGNFSTEIDGFSLEDLVQRDPQAIFTWINGSFTWRWDVANARTRAPLATTTYGLTGVWGTPWQFMNMARGETIGLGQLESVNLYRSVWMALMGDPTLRLHILAPPTQLQPVRSDPVGPITISWQPSRDAGLGYHVYRADQPKGRYTRVTPTPMTATTYTDTIASHQPVAYMVRAVAEQPIAMGGSYINQSQGVIVSIAGTTPPVNRRPLIGAGQDQTILLPDGATLQGLMHDDGLPKPPATVAGRWSQVSGPGQATFTEPDALATTATFPQPGTYVLRLTAQDGELESTDEVTIVAAAAPPNTAPVISVSPSGAQVTAGQSVVLTITTTDVNGDAVTVEVEQASQLFPGSTLRRVR